MQKNFSISNGFAEVIFAHQKIDLHNLYKISSIGTDTTGEIFTLVFDRNKKYRPYGLLPERLTLTCSGDLKMGFNELSHLPVQPRDDSVELAYYDRHCGWDQFLDEELATTQGFEGLHISFSGGLVLRISCGVAEIGT